MKTEKKETQETNYMKQKETGRYIYLDEKNQLRTMAFCQDELDYHIYDSGCAWQYHDEIMAELEILCQLGMNGSNYLEDYLPHLREEREDIRHNRPWEKELLKTLDAYVEEVKAYQKLLKRVYR